MTTKIYISQLNRKTLPNFWGGLSHYLANNTKLHSLHYGNDGNLTNGAQVLPSREYLLTLNAFTAGLV